MKLWTSKLWTPSTKHALACAVCGKPHSLRRQLFRPFLHGTFNIGPCACCGGEGPPFEFCSECIEALSGINVTLSGLSNCSTDGTSFNWSNVNGSYSMTPLSSAGSGTYNGASCTRRHYGIDTGTFLDEGDKGPLLFANVGGNEHLDYYVFEIQITIYCCPSAGSVYGVSMAFLMHRTIDAGGDLFGCPPSPDCLQGNVPGAVIGTVGDTGFEASTTFGAFCGSGSNITDSVRTNCADPDGSITISPSFA